MTVRAIQLNHVLLPKTIFQPIIYSGRTVAPCSIRGGIIFLLCPMFFNQPLRCFEWQ